MSEKILTQDEINALLSAVGDPGPGPGPGPGKEPQRRRPEAEPRGEERAVSVNRPSFPILKPRSLSKDVHASLTFIHDSFAQNCGSTLSAGLRAQVQIKLEGMEQLSYGEFINGLPEPSSAWGLRIEPLGFPMALCLDQSLAHSLADLLMGGNGTVPAVNRTISSLDQSVLEAVVRTFSKEFTQAWVRMLDFQVEIVSHETRPGLLQLYGPSESMVLVGMSMKTGPAQGQVYWGLPAQLVKLLRSKIDNQSQARTKETMEEAVNRMKRITSHALVALEARITGTRIRVSDLLELEPGNVIKLDHRVDQPVELAVNGHPKFSGSVLISHDKKAVKINGVSPGAQVAVA